MKQAVVNNASICAQNRLDAKFHLSDGLLVRHLINRCPYRVTTIKDVTEDIYCPGIFKRTYLKNGFMFLGGGDIQKAELDSGKYLNKKRTPNWEILAVKKGWSLVTCGGTIGDVAFTNNLLSQCWISQHVMRVIPNTSRITEGMLYAYLATKYGKLLLTTGTYGSVIPTISSENIAVLPIPQFKQEFQAHIDELMQHSASLRELSADQFHKAIALFEKYIGTSSYDGSFKAKAISSKSISKGFKRFDSQYQIGEHKLSSEISGLKTTKISNVASSIFVGTRGKRHYVRQGIPFLSSSDMMLFNPVKYSTPISVNTPNLEGLLVHTDDILISRSGTIGNTVIVSKTLNGKAVSEHALRLVIDKSKIDPKYVFCYLNTKHGKRLLESLAYGSVIITLGEDLVGNVDLPLLPGDTYAEIVNLISNYSTNLDEATRLENEAVSLVEAEIEKWNKQ